MKQNWTLYNMAMNYKKAKWFNARAKSFGGYATMERINTNKAADIYYRDSATALIEKMMSSLLYDVKNNYRPFYSQNSDKKSPNNTSSVFDEWRIKKMDIFNKQAEKIAFKYVSKVSKMSRNNVDAVIQRFYGKKLAIKYNKERYDQLFKLIVQRNVSLLQNTARQAIENVENIVYNAMTTGQGWEEITKSLDSQREIASNRVKRIARDQTSKSTEAINIMMQRDAGAEYFEWSTSKDERVSTGYGGHKQLDGKIYRYDEPERYPIIDSYGHRGLPSQRVQCRCTALSVFIMDGYKAQWSPSDECYRIIKK